MIKFKPSVLKINRKYAEEDEFLTRWTGWFIYQFFRNKNDENQISVRAINFQSTTRIGIKIWRWYFLNFIFRSNSFKNSSSPISQLFLRKHQFLSLFSKNLFFEIKFSTIVDCQQNWYFSQVNCFSSLVEESI